MTVNELAAAAPGWGLGREPWQWQCFGPDCWLVLLGREERYIATAVYHEPTESVLALELLEGSRSVWVDPDFVSQWLDELDPEEEINLTMDWVTVLAELRSFTDSEDLANE